MRVIIIDSLIGNDYTINLCRALQKVVSSLTLILPKNRKVESLNNVKVKHWAPSKDVNVSKIRKSVDYVLFLLRLFIFIKFDRNCVVHFQFFRRKSDVYFLTILRFFGVRVVYTAHNILPHEIKKFDRFRANILYKASKAIIVHSDFIKKKLIKEFPFCATKSHIVPHGNFDNYLPDAPISKQVARRHFDLSVIDKVILFFGYIREYKGLDLLIDAFELAAAKDEKIKLVIAGAPINDALKNKYNSQILKSNFRDRIIDHFNFIPSENIPLYFESSDILILPYKSIDHSGIIHLSYSFSKPVIVTNVGDFSEVVEQNKSGKIIDNHTASSLADTILELILNDDLEKMGEYAKCLSETKYSWENVSKLTANVYSTVIQ